MLNYKSNAELLKDFDKRVHGHTEAKKALISLVNRSKIRHHQKWIANEHKENWATIGKCLLIGGSGTGKTFLVNTLRELVHFPMISVDATYFNPTGASGGIKAKDLAKMIVENAQCEAESKNGYCNSVDGTIDQTVIFIDEVDKLANKWSTGNWNEQVQSCFLTLIENNSDFDGVSFIFAGAFSGMEKSTTTKKTIGFNNTSSKEEAFNMDEALVQYGLLPELVGRMNSIVTLDELTLQDYRDILDNKLLPQKYREQSYCDCDNIALTEKEKDTITKHAKESGQGVRALKRELDKLLFDAEFNLEYVEKRQLTLDEFTEEQSSVYGLVRE